MLTSDLQLIEKIKMLRNHGIQSINNRIDFIDAGFNYRLTDFQAALLQGQLDRFPEELKSRFSLAKLYRSNLLGHSLLHVPSDTSGHSWQSFMVVLDDSIDRDGFINMMAQCGVQTNLGAQALNCLSYFSRKYGYIDTDFPVATKLYRYGLVLPIYGSMNESDVNYITDTLKQLFV